MLSLYPRNPFWSPLRTSITAATRFSPARHASLNSAINRGIRKSRGVEDYSRSRDRDRDSDSRPQRLDERDSRKPWKSKSEFDENKGKFTRGSAGLDGRKSDGFSRRGDRDSKLERFEEKDTRKPNAFSRGRDRDLKPQRFEDKDARKPWKSKSEFDDGGSGRDFSNKRDRDSRPRRSDDRDPRRSYKPKTEFDEDAFIKLGKFQALPRELQSPQRPRFSSERTDNNSRGSSYTQDRPSRSRESSTQDRDFGGRTPKRQERNAHRITDKIPERVKKNVLPPSEIPYTTPASQFVCGTSAIEAALRCERRQLYKLYIYQNMDEELNDAKVGIRKLALAKNVPVKMAFGEWDRILDKMSAGRPHNGCVLEASPLPQRPVLNLQAVPSAEEPYFNVELGLQSKEEALVNGTSPRVTINNALQARYPVVVLLDGVVDTGNMGAIIRSAYYLGIDAIVFAGRNSARLSAVSTKTAAGAAENMPLLHTRNEVAFIQQSKANGWRFLAADAPGPNPKLIDPVTLYSNGEGTPLAQAPTVLMLGNENTGLSGHLRRQADAIISLPGARISSALGVKADPARVDSLNVSVAAALLMNMFLRMPVATLETNKVW
ncbi:alpha/beta knot [Aspergillus heteromorphus CBS 117.55]|uniref:rRNA methyltransferase 1, mitochondrial n=1 Tax=Aspergillus heteromorphus CBS 117.55 TaxID=1448321 RepID=A0A317W1J8_9EURO|nr:alpha/beta knot [Aspergillus heteromorphus CBS 117.55]PWY80516.1 alpha/beta knot [Aspergillus heteromorphus CBS 117.55]